MSSQSINYELIYTLQMIKKYLYQYGLLSFLILGTISCIFSLIVFSKKVFRKSPCSTYMIAYYSGNLIYIYTVILPVILAFGYNQSFSVENIHVCRFILYMAIVFSVLSSHYLILASIDRILITSSNAATRRRSTQRLAFISTMSLTLFWFLCNTHILVFSKIFQVAPNYFVCYLQDELYYTIFIYYSLTRTVLTPLILAYLGYLGIKNVRQISKHQAPVNGSHTEITAHGNLQNSQSKDLQLIRIVLIDVAIYVISSFPVAIISIYIQATQYYITNVEQTPVITLIQDVCGILLHISYCIGFYKNLFISKAFRNEVKKIFVNQQKFCFRLYFLTKMS
ncbi:hypothetical protein I4U23_010714 [Adineta vaga]|nr:hypothetical protein I4U23_010714 [Adineta vaga]